MSLKISQVKSIVGLKTDSYEVRWDLGKGGIPAYFANLKTGTILIDAKKTGLAGEIIVSVSNSLEEEPREIKMSGMGLAHAEILFAEDKHSGEIIFKVADKAIEIERIISFSDESAWLEEKISVKNISDKDILIDRYPEWEQHGGAVAGDLYDYRVRPGGVEYILNGIKIGKEWKDDEYVTPACGYPFFHNHGLFSEMGKTEVNLCAGHHGAVFPCIMAYNKNKRSGFLLSIMNQRALRYVHAAADSKKKAGTLSARIWWARWLSPLEKQEAGIIHLVPFEGDYSEMLVEYRDWLSERWGLKAPENVSEKLDDHFAFGVPGVLTWKLGSFEKLIPYIDYAKKLGFTVFFNSGDWNDAADCVKGAILSRCQPITKNDRYAISDKLGGEKKHKIIRDHVHKLGMKFAVWVTGYGLTSFDPMFKEHRDAFITVRKPIKSPMKFCADWIGFDFSLGWADDWAYHPFGGPTVGPDTTNQHWRKFWLHNQDYWSKNGVDGIFFDSFNPMPPNYNLRPWPGQISREIINLQRNARKIARKNNPDFFTMTEGGGCEMQTVNDFTHTWSGATPPPLPPFRKRPLSPEEEAIFLRDEIISMIRGARSWRALADGGHQCLQWDPDETRPRILCSMFTNTLPVIPLFTRDDNNKIFKTQTEYWLDFKPRNLDKIDPRDEELWKSYAKLWKIRIANPELKSTATDPIPINSSDPAVFSFIRRKGKNISIIAINCRKSRTDCLLSADLKDFRLNKSDKFSIASLLDGKTLGTSSVSDILKGFKVGIGSRNGVVLKLSLVK